MERRSDQFSSATPSDDELMARLAAGDLAALELLVVRYRQLAWSVAWRYSGDPVEAEDLVQDGFLTLLTHAGQYQPTGRFRSYLLTILARRAISWRRRLKRLLFEEVDDREAGGAVDQLHEEAARQSWVREALPRLPARQRMALVLRCYEGLSYQEIATVLATTPKSVERLLQRARETLVQWRSVDATD